MVHLSDLLIKMEASENNESIHILKVKVKIKVKIVTPLAFLVWWLALGPFMPHVCPRTTVDFPSNHGRGTNPTHGSGRVSFLGRSRNKRSSLKARFFREIRARGANRQCDAMWKLPCVCVWGGGGQGGLGMRFCEPEKVSEEKSRGSVRPCHGSRG